MHKTKLVSADLSNIHYFSEVLIVQREADSVSPEPRSHFSVHSTHSLLLLPAGQPACGLWLDRRVGRKIECTVL